MRSLRQDGWEKVRMARRIDEIQRITSTFNISYDLSDMDE